MSLCTCKSCGCYFANLETAACPACYKAAVSYAVALENAAHDALGFADGIASTTGNTLAARIADHLRTALKDPEQPALGSLSSPQTGAHPERTETGPNTARPVPCAERDEMCWRRSCRAQDTCVEREMRERDSRHQSCTKSRRQIVFDWVMGEEAAGPNSGWWGTSEAVAHVDELLAALDKCVHQVGRNDELKTAATALYKWLLAVPHMDPPMARFSIPDEIWEPFQDALFDGAKP